MSWNYRICKSTHDGYTEYAIHECYDSHSITVNPVTVSVSEEENEINDESAKQELKWVLEKMLESISKPIIDADNI